MGRNAQERRKARKAKATRSRPRAAGGGPVIAIAEHSQTAEGWRTELYADMPDGSARAADVGPFPTVRETFHAAMATVCELADVVGSVMTVHRLDGSADRWALLAAREGLADDAGCDCGQCSVAVLPL